MKTLILSILLFSQISLACNPVTYLTKGSSAACNGYLFSPEKEREVREMTIKYGTMEKLVNQQDEVIRTQDQRIDVLMQQNVNLRNQNDSMESRNQLETAIYFAIGMVIGYGLSKGFNR